MALDIPVPPQVAPAIARRAVEWLVELQAGTPSADLRDAWQRWRAAHPDHERAWRHVEIAHAHWQGVASPMASATAQAVLAQPGSPGRRHAVKTLALLVFTGSGLATGAATAPWDNWLADERTGIGERRTLRLAEGSTVTMNGDSALDIDSHLHRVRLAAGEILASMPSARTLPLTVETAHGTLRALGARFAVRLLANASRIAVFDGTVDLFAADGAHMQLHAGQGTRIGHGGIARPVAADEALTAWADGMLIGGHMRLDEFLAELARYRRGTIHCDPAVAGLRVAGTFPLADTDRVLRAIAGVLPIEVVHFTRYYVMVRPRQ